MPQLCTYYPYTHTADIHTADIHTADIYTADIYTADIHTPFLPTTPLRLNGFAFISPSHGTPYSCPLTGPLTGHWVLFSLRGVFLFCYSLYIGDLTVPQIYLLYVCL